LTVEAVMAADWTLAGLETGSICPEGRWLGLRWGTLRAMMSGRHRVVVVGPIGEIWPFSWNSIEGAGHRTYEYQSTIITKVCYIQGNRFIRVLRKAQLAFAVISEGGFGIVSESTEKFSVLSLNSSMHLWNSSIVSSSDPLAASLSSLPNSALL
jgi:hypothetical protein